MRDDTLYAQFYNFLEKVGDFVAILKPDGQIVQVNENGRFLLMLEHVDHIYMADLVQMEAAEYTAMVDTAVATGSWQGEVVLTSGEGIYVPVKANLVTNQSSDGEVDFLGFIANDITDRKWVESSLLESETRFYGAFNNTAVGMSIISTDGMFLQVNPAFCNHTGYSEAEMMQLSLKDLLHPDHFKRNKENIARLRSGKLTNLQQEISFITKNKEVRWAVVNVGSIHDVDGHLMSFMMQLQDITEARETEESLRLSEEQNRQIVDNALDAVVSMEVDGRIIGWNRQAQNIFGWSAEEIVGQLMNKTIIPQQYRELYRTEMARYRETGHGFAFDERVEVEGLHKDGHIFPVELSMTSVQVSDREIYNAFLRDLTERHKAEATVRQLSGAVEQAATPVVITDIRGVIEYVNPAFERLTGYTVDEAIGQPMSILKSGKHDKQYYAELWNTILAGKEFHAVTVNKKKNGEIYYEEKNITPIKNNIGEITHFLATGQDVTERYERERHIQEELEKRSREVALVTEIAQEVASAADLTDLYKRVVTSVKEGFGYYHTQLLRYDPLQDVVELIVGYGKVGEKMREMGHSMSMGAGLIGVAAKSGQSVRRSDVTEDPNWQTNPLLPETRSELAVPIKFGDEILGVLDVQSAKVGGISPSEQLVMEGLCGQIAIAIESTRLQQEMAANLRVIIDNVPQGIFWKDRNSVYQGCNKYFANAAGLTPEEMVGKNDYELPWKKEESDAYVEIDQRVMSSGKDELGVIEPQQQADGTETWVETNKIPLFNDDNEVIGILGTFKDITEQMRLQKQIEQSLAQRSQEVDLVTEVAQEIARATDLNDLYRRVVAEVKEQFGYYHTQLLRYDTDLDSVVLIAGYGEIGQKMQAMNHSLPMGVGLIGIAAETGQSVLRPDVSKAADWQANPLLAETRSELAVPIKLGDEILGVLDIQSDQVDGISVEEQLVLEGLCGQIAVAIESKRLQQEMESNLRELATLQRYMTREGWADYKKIKKELKGFAYDQSGVYTIDAVGHEKSNGEATAVTTESPSVNERKGFIKAKLSVRDETFGMIMIQDDLERPLTPEEKSLLQDVSQQVAEALEAARLFEETQNALSEQERLTSDLETVAQVSTAASTILETETLLQSVVDLAKSSFNLYHAHVYLVDGTGESLVLSAGAGNVGRLMSLEGRIININDTALVARAARTRRGILENDVRKTIDFMPHPLLPDTKAEIAQPMVVGNKLIGILDLQADQVNAFTTEDLQIHQILASQIAVAVENATQYSEQVETSSKLREVDRLKSEFLASMSHELRTPLNSIIGFADVLLEGLDGELNERMDQDVRLIKDSGTHLRDLIGDILDMSKIEAGRMELRYEEIDLRQMAHDILATANPLAKEKQLALHLSLDDDVTSIEADRTRLRQVLWNIMGNAIKFTEKGSVTLGMRVDKDVVRVSIKDTGIGIKPEDIGVVFEQFRQVDGSLNRSVGGTGLGMPITKKLVELHGGVINVDSVPGHGSTFWFTLPIEKPAVSTERSGTGPLPTLG